MGPRRRWGPLRSKRWRRAVGRGRPPTRRRTGRRSRARPPPARRRRGPFGSIPRRSGACSSGFPDSTSRTDRSLPARSPPSPPLSTPPVQHEEQERGGGGNQRNHGFFQGTFRNTLSRQMDGDSGQGKEEREPGHAGQVRRLPQGRAPRGGGGEGDPGGTRKKGGFGPLSP